MIENKGNYELETETIENRINLRLHTLRGEKDERGSGKASGDNLCLFSVRGINNPSPE